jgi:hypothetical protein
VKATRVIVLMFLFVSLSACNDAARRERQSKELMNEANLLMKRDTDVTGQWVNVFAKTFTQENRRKFPANRDFFRAPAAEIIKLLDESSRLNNSAAEKYEQAAALINNAQQRSGMTSIASSFRKTVEANELIKSQMQMVSDETIVDEKTFNERMLHSWDLIRQKQDERSRMMEEGKRLLLS